MSELTMGQRTYAEAVLQLIDSDKREQEIIFDMKIPSQFPNEIRTLLVAYLQEIIDTAGQTLVASIFENETENKTYLRAERS